MTKSFWHAAVIRKRVPAPPAADGTYTLKCTVTDGVPSYSWEV